MCSSLSGREDLSWQGVRQEEGLRRQNCHEKAKVGEVRGKSEQRKEKWRGRFSRSDQLLTRAHACRQHPLPLRLKLLDRAGGYQSKEGDADRQLPANR